jgi:hypothetical protein
VKHYLLLPWVVFLLLLPGCGPKKHATEIYQAYSGPIKSTETVASILMVVLSDTSDYVDWVNIDNTRIDHDEYGEIRIAPGAYLLEWGRKFNISPMIKASGTEKRNWSTNMKLEAGHSYTIHAKRTIGHGYKIYSWVTDDTLYKVVWGKKYIPGPYDYLLNK